MSNYYTIGARFSNSSNTYTYKVPVGCELREGQYVVVETTNGPAVVTVVEIHDTLKDTLAHVKYKFIFGTIKTVEVPA